MFWSVLLWLLSLSGYFHQPQDPLRILSKVTATSFSFLPHECRSVSGLRLSLSTNRVDMCPSTSHAGCSPWNPCSLPGGLPSSVPHPRLSHPRPPSRLQPPPPCLPLGIIASHVLVIFSSVFIFIWRIIALQYCVGFCHTST